MPGTVGVILVRLTPMLQIAGAGEREHAVAVPPVFEHKGDPIDCRIIPKLEGYPYPA